MGTGPSTPGLMSRSLHLKHTGRSPTLPPAQGSQGPPPPRASALGSSPLTRGLQLLEPGRHLLGGIIPARAGFTCRAASKSTSAADHPRSRGVYVRDPTSHRLTVGSSPLARGLLLGEVLPVPHVGIIPARAGFTAAAWKIASNMRDHPRPRGVYALIPFQIVTIPGSSPLARGLRHLDIIVQCGFRIIPARAGFT